MALCTDQIKTSTLPHHNLPPWQTSGIRPLSLPREWEIWWLKPSQGEEFDLFPGDVGKIEKVKMIFWGPTTVANSYKHFCAWDERDIAIS